MALALFGAMPAQAQSKQPIRILVGFPAGGGLDTVARVLADTLASILDQPVVVDNRPGAGGLMAAHVLKAAPADGHTLLLTNDHTVAILPHTLKNPGFVAERDFAPVALVSDKGVFALATPVSTGIVQLKDIGEWSRRRKGKVSMGVPAPGSMPEFAVGLIAHALQVHATPVPYRGGSPLVMDLSAAQIDFGLSSTAEMLPFVKSQKLRLLAVSGSSRQADLPDVPTFSEVGVQGLELNNLVGIYAPKGTPAALLARYSAAIRGALTLDKVATRMQALGIPPSHGGPETLARDMQRISDAWGPVIRQSGYQPQ